MTDREVLGKGTGENWHSRKFDGQQIIGGA